MTASEILRRITGYYGAYPQELPVLAEEIARYLAEKRPSYLDALWMVVRDRHPKYRGAPDVKTLRDLHELALTEEQYHAPRRLDDTRDNLPHDSLSRGLSEIVEGLLGKAMPQLQGQEAHYQGRALPPMSHLDGLRGDEPCPLIDTSHMSLEEMYRHYAARRLSRRPAKKAHTTEQPQVEAS